MDELLIIKRGYVYEFETKSDFSGKCYALAVSADSRGADNLVSVILLSSTYAPDYVQVANSQFPEGVLYCNCGKVTFTERARLTREVFKISAKKMERIDRLIGNALGLNPAALEVENRVYKELYLELLDRVLGGDKVKTEEATHE